MSEESPTEPSLTAVQRFRARQKAAKLGLLNPDLVAPKQKTGPKPSATSTNKALNSQRWRLRKEAAKYGIVIPYLPKGRPEEDPTLTMDLFNTLLGGSTERPLTEEERLSRLLDRRIESDKQQTDIDKHESARRLLATQNEALFAAAALEREKQATSDATNRRQRQEELSSAYKAYERSAQKATKPHLDDDDEDMVPGLPAPTVVQPSPARRPTPRKTVPRSTKKVTAKNPPKTPDSKKTAMNPTPRTTRSKRSSTLHTMDPQDHDDVLTKLSVEAIWYFEKEHLFKAVHAAWKLNLFEEASDPNYTGKTLDEDVLYALCERLNKDDPEDADFYLEDCDDTSVSALAGALNDYMEIIAKRHNKDAKKKKARRA